MKKLALAAVAAMSFWGSAQAATVIYKTSLGPEVAGATGSGSVVLSYDTISHDLTFDVDFSGLSGVTTVAHIHCCVPVAFAGTVGVAVSPGTLPGFPVGVSSGSYDFTIDLADPAVFTNAFRNANGGTADGARAALLTGMNAGHAYFNIHSSLFQSGEIRGFLVIPEPAPLALALIPLGLLALRRRRA